MKTDEWIGLICVLIVLSVFVGGAWWITLSGVGIGEREYPPRYWLGLACVLSVTVVLPAAAAVGIYCLLCRIVHDNHWLWFVFCIIVSIYWLFWFEQFLFVTRKAAHHPERWQNTTLEGPY